MSVSTDLTATEKTAFNDRDWTVGIKLGRDKIGRLLLGGHVRANLAQLAAPNKPHEFVPFGIRAAFGSRLRVRYRISISPVGGPLE